MATSTRPHFPLEEERLLLLKSIRVPPEEEAKNTLCQRYDACLRRFFRFRADPNDCMDLWATVWVAIFETSPEKVEGIKTSVRAYIFGIARHVLLDYYNERKRSPDQLASSVAAFDTTLSRRVAQKESVEILQEALQKLDDDEKMLLSLRYFEEMRTRELAEIYGIPEGTIKRQLFTVRRRLAELMRPDRPGSAATE